MNAVFAKVLELSKTPLSSLAIGGRNFIAILNFVFFAGFYWMYVETYEDETSRKTLWVQILHGSSWTLLAILNIGGITTLVDALIGIASCCPMFLVTVRGPHLPKDMVPGFDSWTLVIDLFIWLLAAFWLLYWLKFAHCIQQTWPGMVVLVVIVFLKPFHIFLCGNQGAVNWSTYITIIAGWIPLISHNLVHQRAKEGQQDTTAMANSVCNSDPSVPAASQSNSHSSGAPLAADMEHTDAGDPANEDETAAPRRVSGNLQEPVHPDGLRQRQQVVVAGGENKATRYSYKAVCFAVMEAGSTRFLQIGMGLGYSMDAVDVITSAQIRPGDKVLALIEGKRSQIGELDTKLKLLKVCETIEPPIIGAVLHELERDGQ